MKILQLFLEARFFKIKGGTDDFRIMDAAAFQHAAHQLRVIAVHADGFQVAAVDTGGLQKCLQRAGTVVRQITPWDGGSQALTGIGVVGGTGEQNSIHILVCLEQSGGVGGLLEKFGTAVGELNVRKVFFSHFSNNIYRYFRTNHTNFHSKNLPFDN